ncbi:hypothetical protein QR680_015903 [Steinernema hermaphroditum]|uniref:lysozyme n=1 Tax=Steinernema hermaphroditum TaxID=289476 RepID=A0AA39H9D3_9BILA|nr:hypothetical protein QR680_015903 [Steinernema hermaphroditum]
MLHKSLPFVFFITFAASKDCLQCICELESGCAPIGCNMDQGTLSCGYFQIKLPYYIDCGTPGQQPGESTEAAWKRCADDYSCAVQCVESYINRYAGNCPGKGYCERMSRLHNGGPNGCNTGVIMMLKSVLLALFVAVVVSKDCLRCICEVESGCRAIGCNRDKGSDSCGYYQIKLPYYIDCGTPGKQPGESNETAWRRCANDYNCATQCVNAYIKRYSEKCPGKGSCEKTARLHNGGPNGCNVGGTVGYWQKVQRCCGCN